MSDLRWFAAYVRCRHEKRVADHLAVRNVDRFLPLYQEQREWSDRKTLVLLPLFPGYIFIRIDRNDRLCVLEIPGVLYLIGSGGHPEALEDAEIEQLRAAARPGNDPRPHAFVHVGDRVLVTRGPLEGTEGYVVREKNKSRVVLALDLIQRAMSVEVDSNAIAPVPQIRRNARWQAQCGRAI